MKHKYILPLSLLLLWLTLIICFYLFVNTSIYSFEEMIFWIYNFIQQSWTIWVIFFLIIYIIRPLFFIIASPFDMLSWAIFWLWGGIGISFLATACSVAFSYGVGYFTGWKMITIPKKFLRIQKIESKIREKTFFHIFMLRIIAFPFDLLSYLSWVFKIPFRSFWIASIIWTLPFTLVSVTAGSAFYWDNLKSFSQLRESIEYEKLLFALLLLIFVVLGTQIMKRYFRYREEHIL